MIRKVRSPHWTSYFTYWFGRDPQEEWEFQVDNLKCRVINGWKSGAKLYVNDNLVSENNELISVSGDKPLLEATLKNITISVYVKSILSTKIRVAVNGNFIQENYV